MPIAGMLFAESSQVVVLMRAFRCVCCFHGELGVKRGVRGTYSLSWNRVCFVVAIVIISDEDHATAVISLLLEVEDGANCGCCLWHHG